MKNYLIVVDMQNDFISGALGTPEAVSILPEAVRIVREFEGEVIFTRDTHTKEYLNTQEGRNLPVEHCIKGTDGWQIAEELAELTDKEKTVIFDKPTFGSRELGEYLAKENEREKIGKITLIGICTDICVISNAMLIKAFLPETEISVIASACAGVTPESHNRALEAMKICQIEVAPSVT